MNLREYFCLNGSFAQIKQVSEIRVKVLIGLANYLFNLDWQSSIKEPCLRWGDAVMVIIVFYRIPMRMNFFSLLNKLHENRKHFLDRLVLVIDAFSSSDRAILIPLHHRLSKFIVSFLDLESLINLLISWYWLIGRRGSFVFILRIFLSAPLPILKIVNNSLNKI